MAKIGEQLGRVSIPLGERLFAEGLIDKEQLDKALDQQKQSGWFIGETLVTLGYVKSEEIGPYLAASTGFPFIDLSNETVDIGVARMVSESTARRKLMLPFRRQGDEVHVAMADPLDLAALDALRGCVQQRVIPYLAFRSDINEKINVAFDAKNKAQAILEEIPDSVLEGPELSPDELIGLAEDAPIVRLVNGIIQSALASSASDIHIEPQEHNVRVRYRVDGLLYDQMTLPRNHLAATVSRIKIMGHMNIAERRRPQDGRFTVRDERGTAYDLRCSVLPTVYGEKVVMRILEKSVSLATLERLGFFPEQHMVFEKFIRRPHGIILVTGPTGSGKSTTLYAALQTINNSTLNINTIEDPVEYRLPGANQTQVNPKIGVNFASGLRTLLRQDPDVIMVGEIRDYETAEIAIQAALTGHLVLSTLHTNNAPGALVRLQNMGVEPYLVSSAIVGVVAQRLLRTVCSNCREQVQAQQTYIEALGLPLANGRRPTVSVGKGCGKCGHRGLKGRTAVFEIMPMTEEIRSLVLRHASDSELMVQAKADGMSTLRESGIRKILECATTPEEVLRVLFTEE
jgi:type IV pilus assembly protein PilB